MPNPWMKFFPSDWRSDPALRMCGVAARGLWMEMLCIMHEANPRGSLMVNGKAVNERQLASLAGLPPREVQVLIVELEEAGVFSRDADGTIFSRRMRRDDEKAARDKANGKRGGNPKLDAGVGEGVNPPVDPPPPPQKPEATGHSVSETRAREASVTQDAFDIASELLAAKGLPNDAVEGSGLPYQAQTWLNEGIPKPFILATAVRVVGTKPKFPHINYLVSAMRSEWENHCARRDNPQEPQHAKTPRRNGITAAIDGYIERFEREEIEAREVRETPAGLLPDGRRH